jgi:hypothetical protein
VVDDCIAQNAIEPGDGRLVLAQTAFSFHGP